MTDLAQAMETETAGGTDGREPTCPRASERKTPPENDELIDPKCWECPLLMREVDERGVMSLYCLVYRNRFNPLILRSPSLLAHPQRQRGDGRLTLPRSQNYAPDG